MRRWRGGAVCCTDSPDPCALPRLTAVMSRANRTQIGSSPMDLVLGLSMTSSSVRWVLVEGTTGEGATLERGSLPADSDAAFDANALLSALLDNAGGR